MNLVARLRAISERLTAIAKGTRLKVADLMSDRRYTAVRGWNAACESWRRPYSRRAILPEQREKQLRISRRPAMPAPRIREKRLNTVTGKWERAT